MNNLIFNATLLGWTPAECHNVAKSCYHTNTNGTERCIECGMTTLSFAASATDYIDKHKHKLIRMLLKGELVLVKA